MCPPTSNRPVQRGIWSPTDDRSTIVVVMFAVVGLLAGCDAEPSNEVPTPQPSSPMAAAAPGKTDVPQQRQPNEARAVSKPPQDRPPLDFMGPYNVPRSEFPGSEIWAESDNVDELTVDEFFDVRTDVVAALSKHGNVYGESEGEHDFFVYDDKFFDRTQKIELEESERLPRIIAPAVADLQTVLKKHSLWRIMFIGHGRDDQAEEQFFIVYPDAVRIRQLQGNNTTPDALVENARLRLAHRLGRAEHQKNRNNALETAIIQAFSQMERSNDDAVLVAWFDTVSGLDWDWGGEGKPGTSVWVLLREPLPDEFKDVFQSNIEFSIYWATSDGGLTDDGASKAADARQLLHFEDDQKVQDELVFHLNRQRIRYSRPKNSR